MFNHVTGLLKLQPNGLGWYKDIPALRVWLQQAKPWQGKWLLSSTALDQHRVWTGMEIWVSSTRSCPKFPTSSFCPLQDGIDTLNAVGFVVQSTTSKLSITQRYIFESGAESPVHSWIRFMKSFCKNLTLDPKVFGLCTPLSHSNRERFIWIAHL